MQLSITTEQIIDFPETEYKSFNKLINTLTLMHIRTVRRTSNTKEI